MDLTGAQRGDVLRASQVRELARVAQRARPAKGSGVLTGAGGTGPVRDDAGWFLVKITDVTGSGSTATYSFTEQYVVTANGGIDPAKNPGDTEDWTVPRTADMAVNPARSAVGTHTFAKDEIALARRSLGSPMEFELWPAGGSDWEPYQITDNANTDAAGTPVYSWKKVKLAPDPVTGYPAWQDVSPAVTGTDNAYRMPSASYIPPLIDIGQVVLGRASPTDPGKYELTPWGGQRRNIKKDLVDVQVSCGPDSNGSPTMIVVKTYRYLRFHGRDFCLTLGATTDSEQIG